MTTRNPADIKRPARLPGSFERLSASRARLNELHAWAQSLADEAEVTQQRSGEVRKELAAPEQTIMHDTPPTSRGLEELYAEVVERWNALCVQVDDKRPET